MPESPRTWQEAMAWAAAQSHDRSQDWTSMCQKFVRSCYGIPPLFGSAYAQWLGADSVDRHVGGSPNDAPVGAALCYKGSSEFGHICLAARPFPSGSKGAWGTDMVRRGWPDKHLRTAPVTVWNQRYLGYLTAVNGFDLRLFEQKPPAPTQDKRYTSIGLAIERLRDARETARNQKDEHDIKVLTEEIDRLKRLYDRLRHA